MDFDFTIHLFWSISVAEKLLPKKQPKKNCLKKPPKKTHQKNCPEKTAKKTYQKNRQKKQD